MAIINTYPDDTSIQDNDKFLTYTADGAVKLAPASTFKSYTAGAGWLSANESWTFSSYDSTNKTGVITVPTDATLKYTLGMRVMFTNNAATQYGLVTAITSTTLTVYFGTTYSLTNSAITSPFYSTFKAPFGFPLDPTKWQVELVDTSAPTKTSPVAGTWYGNTALSPTGISISVPIGAWDIFYKGTLDTTNSSTASTVSGIQTTLSTTTTTETDTMFTTYYRQNASVTSQLRSPFAARGFKVFTTATPMYALLAASDAPATIALRGSAATTVIRATSAYL